MKTENAIEHLEVKLKKLFAKKKTDVDYSTETEEFEKLNKEECVKSKNRCIGFMDMASVMCICFKNDNLAKWFLNTFESKPFISPLLDYSDYDKEGRNGIPKVKFSTDYMTSIMNLFAYNDWADVTIKKDFPLTISNDDFFVILAPSVEPD